VSELLELASRIAGRAVAGEDIEAFVTHERNFSVKTFDAEVENLSSAEPRGVGIRLVTGARAGFAYTTDLTEKGIDVALGLARDNARHATPDEALGLAPAWRQEVAEVEGLFDDSFPSVSPEEKVSFALSLERATKVADPRIRTVEEAVYSDSDAEVAIATSTGVTASYRETSAWCYSIAIAADGDDTQVGFDFDLARGLGGLDAHSLARRAANRALGVLGATKIPSAKMPVVFDPYTAGQFLGVLASALSAEAVQKGRSLFAGRVGDKVAAEGLSLVDDGRVPAAPGSAPWDGEGVPTRRTEVIRDGVLQSFLYDLTTAKREGRDSTGNASRSGFKSAPSPAPTNLAFEAPGGSRADVLARAGKALLVQDFHGVHSGANPVSGDFSVGVTGRILNGGELGAPVKEVTIALPMVDILSRIVAVADDRRWLPFGGSYGGATTLVSEMTVGGR
jgi:PmbA protein